MCQSHWARHELSHKSATPWLELTYESWHARMRLNSWKFLSNFHSGSELFWEMSWVLEQKQKKIKPSSSPQPPPAPPPGTIYAFFQPGLLPPLFWRTTSDQPQGLTSQVVWVFMTPMTRVAHKSQKTCAFRTRIRVSWLELLPLVAQKGQDFC